MPPRAAPRWAAGLQRSFPRGCAVLFNTPPSAQQRVRTRGLCAVGTAAQPQQRAARSLTRGAPRAQAGPAGAAASVSESEPLSPPDVEAVAETSEAVAVASWVQAALDAERSLADLRAATAAAAARDASALRVFAAAARSLADTRASLAVDPGAAAEAAVLAQLDARVAGILADTSAAAEARRARAERLGEAAAAAANAARDAACGRLARASEAARAYAADHVALCNALTAAEARLAAPGEAAQTRADSAPSSPVADAASVAELRAALAAESARADALAAEVAALRSREAESSASPLADDGPRRPARARATREPGAAPAPPVSAADAAADAALRAAAASVWASAAERLAANDAAWAAFAASPPARIREEHVPWPDADAVREAAAPTAGGAPGGGVDVRALRARWHPDRFAQKFGARIAAEERDAVLSRVTDVAARLNAIALPLH